MIVADAPWHKTGYGIQGLLLADQIKRRGHDTMIYAPGGFQGGTLLWSGHRGDHQDHIVLGANMGDDRAGSLGFAYWTDFYKPDLVITLLDANALGAYGWLGSAIWMWAPIDTWPIPPRELGILARADRILVPSGWGLDILEQSGLRGTYAPYTLDPSANYYPSRDARKAFRDSLHIGEDTFLIGMVGVHYPHPDRKGFTYAMEAISRFVALYPDAPIKAYFQTQVVTEDPAHYLDLYQVRQQFGMDRVIGFAPATGPRYLSDWEMRSRYNGFDCLLAPSIAEGFGIPVLEAQACGTPAIVNAATALTELIGPGSFGANPASSQIVMDCSMASIPSVDMLTHALYLAYHEWLESADLRREGSHPANSANLSNWAHNKYDTDAIWARIWAPLFEEIEESFVAQPTPDGRITLNLGCGTKPIFPEALGDVTVNHDRTLHSPYVGVAHDLNELPWPFGDDEFTEILMFDVIEHLSADVPAVMDECHRILSKSPGARLEIRTCVQGSWQHETDPTHTRGFNLFSFDYFDPTLPLGHEYGIAYTAYPWRMIKKGLTETGDLIFVLAPLGQEPEVTQGTNAPPELTHADR